jgi:hypothetical protein
MTDWAPHSGVAILGRPYKRVEFWQLAMTATHLLLDLGDRQVRVEWRRVQKLDLTVTPAMDAAAQQREWKAWYDQAQRDVAQPVLESGG